MKEIVQMFSNDTALNDEKVFRFVQAHFKVTFKQPFIGLNQCCKKLL